MQSFSWSSFSFLALAAALFSSAGQAQKIVGKPGGNALLYFVQPGSLGLKGHAPTYDQWKTYSQATCPSKKMELWLPKVNGQFCAVNSSALAIGKATTYLCDSDFQANCKLLAGKFVSKGVGTSDPGNVARFWLFDESKKVVVVVSATSDRSSTISSGVANGGHMGGHGGRATADTCNPTSDEFNYSDMREVPDMDGGAFAAYFTLVTDIVGDTIYTTCGR